MFYNLRIHFLSKLLKRHVYVRASLFYNIEYVCLLLTLDVLFFCFVRSGNADHMAWTVSIELFRGPLAKGMLKLD
jgi:hypothetical protein